MRDNPDIKLRCQSAGSSRSQKVLVDIDSSTVVMEVETRLGVCKNSRTESTSPENG